MLDIEKYIEFQVETNQRYNDMTGHKEVPVHFHGPVETIVSARVRLGVSNIIDEVLLTSGNRESIIDMVKRDLTDHLKHEIYGETELLIKKLEAELRYTKDELDNWRRIYGYKENK